MEIIKKNDSGYDSKEIIEEENLKLCINKYYKFIESISDNIENDLKYLGDLITQYNKLTLFFKNDSSFYNKYYKITNKKSKYYVHNYDPSFVNKLISKFNNETQKKMLDSIDLKPKNNCCNCINFVYSKGNIAQLFNNLYSMKKSLDIITECLHQFVVRYYFHPSIFEVIHYNYNSNNSSEKKYAQECFKLLKHILVAKNSEAYIYFSKFNNYINEDNTNINIIRKADVLVSYLDCHNIKLFSSHKVEKIAMLYDLHNYGALNKPNLNIFDLSSNSNFTTHCSDWLKEYSYLKYVFLHDINHDDKINYNYETKKNNLYFKFPQSNYDPHVFMNYIKLFDILRGSIACKIKFSKKYVNNKTNLINSIIDNLEKNKDLFYKLKVRINKNILIEKYDEILFFELFDPFVTLNKSVLNCDHTVKEITENMKNLFIIITPESYYTKNNDYIIDINDTKYNFEFNTKEQIILNYSIEGSKISINGVKEKYILKDIFNIDSYLLNYKTNLKELKDQYYLFFYFADLIYKPEFLITKDYFFGFLPDRHFFHVNYNETINTSNFDILDKIYPNKSIQKNIIYGGQYLKYKENYLNTQKHK